MHSPDRCLFIDSIRVSHQLNLDRPFLQGGLFLYDKTVPPSFISSISLNFVDKNDNVCWVSCDSGGRKIGQTLCPVKWRRGGGKGDWFLSVRLCVWFGSGLGNFVDFEFLVYVLDLAASSDEKQGSD
ncbi:hypothetical protein V6N13_111403 [Hibiscus sabdariffa]|uniref:Uncharacterized protein n=1 Tax=Hibiscus sabdariffa TaxID=183260 RepID=A0ABR2TK40_9ROSI